MSKQSEERGGNVFVGVIVVATGVGLLVSTLTDNWIYMAVCTVIGVGLGFIAQAMVKK